MIRGTTPTHTFNLPIATKTIKAARITYTQKDSIVLEKTEKDVIMQGTAIKVTLTQEETLAFDENTPVKWQVKVLTYDGAVLVSKIKMIPVTEILNEEVLK